MILTFDRIAGTVLLGCWVASMVLTWRDEMKASPNSSLRERVLYVAFIGTLTTIPVMLAVGLAIALVLFPLSMVMLVIGKP